MKKTKTVRDKFNAGEMKDLYTENFKILMKKIKDDTQRWKTSSVNCLWVGRILLK